MFKIKIKNQLTRNISDERGDLGHSLNQQSLRLLLARNPKGFPSELTK